MSKPPPIVSPRRLFITGGTGYLGSVLVVQARAAGWHVAASHYSQSPPNDGTAWVQLDIRDRAAVDATLARLNPDVVIHTAFRQHNPDLEAVTAHGAAHVARAAQAHGARLIHMSSDAIFAGEQEQPYTEDDPPSPIHDYGRAKAAAETLVVAAHPDGAIVRTSLIYGFNPLDRQTQFALDVAAGRKHERLFTDEYRCPVFVYDLAAALLELAQIDHSGIINIAGAERLSRHEIGVLVAQAYGYDPATIAHSRSAESGLQRPRNCTLDIRLAQRTLRTPLRGLRTVLHTQTPNRSIT